MTESVDLAIVGGGAAGLAAAIFAGEAGAGRRILVLDGAKSVGAKILVSGGGRCNVTHERVLPNDFNGPRNIVRNVLAAFDAAAAVGWFASMGVELKREETGKLFPVTDSARTVLNCLLRRCEELGVEIRGSSRVKRIPSATDGSFIVEHSAGTVACRRLILATGGRSLPRSGSDGTGWEIAKELGHTVTPTYAALVPLVLDAKMFHVELAGIAQDVELSTFVGGKLVDRRAGAMLWTHFGISGPVVMDASRHWVVGQESGGRAEMRCNFVHPDGFEKVERWLIELGASRPRLSMINAVAERLPERVGAAILRYLQIESALPIGQLPRDDRRRLVHALTTFPLPVVQQRGWNYAELTAGGVPLAEVDYRTMESRKTPGLYLAGEILDCDGRIGGFNFQWAGVTIFPGSANSSRTSPVSSMPGTGRSGTSPPGP